MTPYYERDGITLYHADCRDLLATLEPGSVDGVITDPPYGIGYCANESTQQGIQKFDAIHGDAELFDPSPLMGYRDVLLWGCNNYCHAIPPQQGQWYFWDKVTRNGIGVRIAEGEYCWHKRGTKPRAFRHLWSGAYRASENGERSMHPMQKPVALLEWCLELVAGDTILDPFAGSCTTGVAAWNLGRKAILCEISEEYCEIGAKRLDRVISQGRLFKPEPVRETQGMLFEEQQFGTPE